MNMVNILACAGMVAGFFLILKLTPMEFTDGIFQHFLKPPDSIKAEIQETQKRKKPSILKREVGLCQDVLSLMKVTGQKFAQTIVMITHNEEIAQLADRIVRIEDGRIVAR